MSLAAVRNWHLDVVAVMAVIVFPTCPLPALYSFPVAFTDLFIDFASQ